MQPPVTRRRASPASELLLSSYFTGIPPRKLLGRDLKSPSPLKGHLSRHSGCGRPDPEEDPGGSSRASWDSPNQVSGTNLRNDCLRSRRCQAHTPTREAGREMRAGKGLCPGETPEIPPVGGPEEHRVPRVPVLGRGRRSHAGGSKRTTLCVPASAQSPAVQPAPASRPAHPLRAARRPS